MLPEAPDSVSKLFEVLPGILQNIKSFKASTKMKSLLATLERIHRIENVDK
jgi:hypothetical protein